MALTCGNVVDGGWQLIAVCELLADFLRTGCGLRRCPRRPQIAFTDSRSREPLGRVPTWQGPRTTGARPLAHQGPDRGTYRRAPLRTGTSSGPRTCEIGIAKRRRIALAALYNQDDHGSRSDCRTSLVLLTAPRGENGQWCNRERRREQAGIKARRSSSESLREATARMIGRAPGMRA